MIPGPFGLCLFQTANLQTASVFTAIVQAMHSREKRHDRPGVVRPHGVVLEIRYPTGNLVKFHSNFKGSIRDDVLQEKADVRETI
jgi:hypothetical protein